MQIFFRTNGSLNISEVSSFLYVCLLAPFIGGLISVWLGADTNWDLMNYHLYNPFAFFHQKLAVDLAPAGMQTYFNPLLDIPYYWMSMSLPAALVGFVMGFMHAGCFVLVALIARQLLMPLPLKDRFRWPLLLAFFGCVTANFGSEFGTTMGDNTTAIFVLLGLLIILRHFSIDQHEKKNVSLTYMSAGILIGLATGLKLTNAVFAVSMCISFFILPITFVTRLKFAILFGIAVVVGISITGGYWFYEMWVHYGNPLFPQFSALFPNDLTNSIAIADLRWGPKNIIEAIFWPIILSINPLRVGELKHHQIIWTIFYIVLLVWIVRIILSRNNNKKIPLTPSAKYILAFVSIAFLVWMKVFSIQRYLAAIEVLVPLVLFVLLNHIFPYEAARKYAKYLLITATTIVYLGGAKTWGHTGWAWDMFSTELPSISAPEKTTVIIAGGSTPFGWLATQFPASIAFAQIDGSFPANFSVYSQRINQIVSSRGGETFVIFPGEPDSNRAKRADEANSILSYFGITQSTNGCAFLNKLIPLLKLQQKVRLDQKSEDACHLTAINFDNLGDQTDAFYQTYAIQQLTKYGYDLDTSNCQTYRAFIGQKAYKYRWCSIGKLP